jgi:mono/diheme cytochrome c family protein
MKLGAGSACLIWLATALVESGFSRIAGVESGFSRTQSITTASGVYTASQAVAGEKIYFARCSMCHGDELEGRERAPALAGAQFLDGWNGKDLRRLLDRIAEMPPGEPVSPGDAVDVLAFLLQTSEMPSGQTALSTDRAKLAEITFERQKP